MDAEGNVTYGGLEWIAWNHAKALKETGNEVTLIAAKGSRPPEGVDLIETVKNSYPRFDFEGKAYKKYESQLHDFDIIWDNSWAHYAGVLQGPDLPILNIMHSPCTFPRVPNKEYPMICGVSRAHSIYAAKLLNCAVRTIYNSIDASLYEYSPTLPEEPNFLSLNRIAPEKAVDKVVDLLAYAGVGGDIVGDDSMIIQNRDYPGMVKRKCEAYSEKSPNKIRYHGLVAHEKKINILKNSRATVLIPEGLPMYYEVFGMAAVESLLVGRPVITNGSGGLGEIVEHGSSGYIVSTRDEFKLATRNIMEGRIKPEECRKRGETFSLETMGKEYQRIMLSVLDGTKW